MGWTEYAGLNLNYLFCAHFRYLVSSFFYILLLIERVMDVPLVSRNDIGSSRNKRYPLKDGMKWMLNAEPKLLILCPFQITIITLRLYSFFLMKESCMLHWCPEKINDQLKIIYTSWRMWWSKYPRLNLNYLFCAHLR